MENGFETGPWVVTKAVADRIKADKSFRNFVKLCVGRYLRQDWGDLSDGDREANDLAALGGSERIFASYKHNEDEKVWIITEWDRSATTILFPEDY